jgi:gamma-glutamylcyclotransferase (GGCT)/AIG2-like uncharacterized protein YtfP
MHVFTYGTLMLPEIWSAVVGRAFATVGGALRGYANYRVRDAVFPGIAATTSDSVVRGVVHLDVDRESLVRLDQFEDAYYRRLSLPISCDDGELREAEAYVIPEEQRGLLTDEFWSVDSFAARGDLERFFALYGGFGRLRSRDG